MALLVGLIDIPGLLFLVIAELFFEREKAHWLSGRIQQSHILAFFELACFLFRYGQRNGKGPKGAARETHPINYPFVISLSHEALERAKCTHSQKLKIREGTGVESDLL